MTTFVPETVRRRHQYRAVSPTTNGACENCGGLPGEASDFCEWPVVSPDEPLRRIAAYLSARDKATADDGATPDQHEERWQACEAARLAMFALLDTAPVASLAPTGDLAELIGELHDAADEVMCNEAPVYQRAARLMHDAALRFRFWPSSLAPTSLAEIPECVEAAYRAVLHLPFVDQLAMKQALRAAEAARPPKGA